MLNKTVKIILCLLAASLVLLILTFVLPSGSILGWPYLIFVFIGIILILGAALIYLTLKINPPKKTKIFLLLAGASAVGVPVFAVMHNLVYAVLTHYWGETIGDEPFFFILATIICPLGLLIGLIGSFIRYRHIAEQPE